MRVFVAGATGVIGRQLVPLLQSAGHEVSALVRDPSRAPASVDALRGDALDRDAVVQAVREARPDAIVHALTALPEFINPRLMRRKLRPTNRLRTEGTANLLAAAREAGVERVVAESIAFAYASRGDRLVDEDAPLALDGAPQFRDGVRAVADLERQVTEARGVVLRLGWLYGPGTSFRRGGAHARLVERRLFPVVGDGGGVWSFVHVRDAAEAFVAALAVDGPRIFNITDDHPAPVSEWLPEYARLLGARPPRRVPAWLTHVTSGAITVDQLTRSRGASNARARAELGWAPRHADWRGGFAEELA